MTRHDSRRVSPFGHLRINAYVRLPEAFRSLSRPSSPVHAKASTVRPCSLDRICSLHLFRDEGHTGPPSPKNTRMVLESFSRTLQPNPSTLVFKVQHDQRECFPQNARPVSCFLSPEGDLLACSRKEVIQPQVPLRLPCYDFAPVTELAFGGSLPCGLGHRLRALPTSMA